MNTTDLLEPNKAYNSFLKEKHKQNAIEYFDELTKKSGINVEANREICKRMYAQQETVKNVTNNVHKARRGKNFFTFLLIFSICVAALGLLIAILCINSKVTGGIVGGFIAFGVCGALIPVSIINLKKSKSKVNNLESELQNEQNKLNEITQEASNSMVNLNALFGENIAPKLFEKTTDIVKMDEVFKQERLQQMIENYGYEIEDNDDKSTLAVQSGTILGNPFFIVHTFNMHMVPHVYEGSLVITWVTTSTDSNGHTRTTTHTQTLRATVTEPRPEYYDDTVLIYANKAGEHLSFSRRPTELSSKGKPAIQKYVSKHEKELSKLAEKELKKGGTYTPLGNSEFEFVFGGLDRDNEVEYRLLFTPLAQKAMLDLLETPAPYGDDFSLIKNKCINTVISAHDQNINLFTNPEYFMGIDYDKTKEKFVAYNEEYFKCIFYDFAPLLCIPIYQQNKAREYIYKDNHHGKYAYFEHETLANKFKIENLRHEDTKTNTILKTKLVSDKNGSDVIEITAHSYDEIPQVTLVPVRGGDGNIHQVPVHWFSYDPLSKVSPMVLTDVGGDIIKYRQSGIQGSSSDDVAYSRGLFSYVVNDNTKNISIASLKDKMSK